MYTFRGIPINPKNISADPFKLSIADTSQGLRSSIDDLIDEVMQVNSSSDPEGAMHRVLKEMRTSSDPAMKAVAASMDSAAKSLSDVDIKGQTESLVRNALALLDSANERAKSNYVNDRANSRVDGGY